MHKAKKKKKEESSKTNDGQSRKEMKDSEGNSPVKRPAVSTDDSDIESKHFNQEGPITVASGIKEKWVNSIVEYYSLPSLLVLVFPYF